MSNNTKTPVKATKDLVNFKANLTKYTETITRLLGRKYGITQDEFMVKVINAVKKNPDLLKCTPVSLFGSIMYFAEIGLPFNTPEGFGYILPYRNGQNTDATPIIGYRGLIEMAYRNPKMKSLRIQSVYENDSFEYEYGTDEYIKHKPATDKRGALTHVYAIAKMEGIDPLFVVIHKDELNKIQKLSKSGTSKYSPYNNGTDVFNIMQSKVAIKQLFKTLPKTNNESLMMALENDNAFDYKRGVKIQANHDGFEITENAQGESKALEQVNMPEININESKEHANMRASSKN